MPTTPLYALPYPTLDDPPNVPADMQELADATDAALNVVQSTRIFATVAALTAWAAPDGSQARAVDVERTYIRIGGAWYRNPDYGSVTATGDSNARVVNQPHLVGRTPSSLLVSSRVTAAIIQIEGLTATTYGLRFFTVSGGNPGAISLTWFWMAWP
jgi:hypothetical protein